MAMTLELESLDSFMQEIYDDRIRIKKMETQGQNESGEPVINFLVVFTYAHIEKGIVIQFVEDCGIAKATSEEEIKATAENRNQKIKEAIQKMKDAGKSFGLGMWTA